MMYWLIPKLFNTKLYSVKMASQHFWIGTLGIILYAIPMYWNAFKSYFMMKAFTPEGTLQYTFLDIMQTAKPFYIVRAIGGTLFLIGVLLMVYNLVKTARQGTFLASEDAEAPALAKAYQAPKNSIWHSLIERKPLLLLTLSLLVVCIGGIVEMVPTFLVKSNVPSLSSVKPYTPLELQGRDIYIREGCYNCHSQMIRPFRYEVARYGEYSKAGEFVYDHPFQWGSKRTGPDLARIGGKYNNAWHFNHMLEPSSTSTGSLMPSYPFLFESDIDKGSTKSKIYAMRKMGVPYPKNYEAVANQDLELQAKSITDDLAQSNIRIVSNREIIALIAYLQRVGKDAKTLPINQKN
jgi:cytochrome c oxidase cbb3-type subunit I/II